MKKLIFCTALVMLFTSCMKNDVEVDAVQRTEDFTATFADGTRADLDGTAVVWNADDHLTIFTKTSHNRQYKVKNLSANGRSATFEYVGYTGSDKTAISNNYAVYPYDAEATILGDVITTTLASEQTYNAECDLTYALMSAKSATNNFSFVNSGALLRFNISTILPDTFDLNYIKVSSQNHNIAGEVTIDTNDHLAVVANNGTNEITLAEINETIDSDIKSFYIAMPAMSFEKSDLSVTFSFSDGDKTFALPAFDLEQGKIKSIDYTIKDAEEFTGNTPGEDVPAASKPANNEIWYTNGSTTEATTPKYSDAFGANIVSNTYDAEKECWVIKFDGEVTMIGKDAFDSCKSLTSVSIPDSVTTIGDYAFYYCISLTSVTIPDSVTAIGTWVFGDCRSLTEFKGKYASEDGRCLIIDGTLNSFAIGCGVTEYTIPDSVTTIGDCAFVDCSSLTSVTIPDSVTTIGEYAFGECSSLTSVTIPDSVTSIGECAFDSCSSLTSVIIPDSVTTIGDYAFFGCTGELIINSKIVETNYFSQPGWLIDAKFTQLTIGNGIEKIGSSAFEGCSSLTSVTIPDNVTTIGDEAFDDCSSLTSVTIGDSVTTIGRSAFYDCSSLTSVTIPDSVTTIGDCAFDGCYNLTSVTIGDSVATIGACAFYYCDSLTSITIPDSVTTIGDCAFRGCDSLTSVTIPDSVTSIGDCAFEGCSSLTSVYCKATTPPAVLFDDGYWDAFYDNASGRKIYVPMESVEAYKSAWGWSVYKSDIVGYNF